MKVKNSFFSTMKEDSSSEESISGNLLTRSGMIKKSSAGVYILLPLGFKISQKVEKIIREEMEAIGCQEVLMPALIPEEVFIKSGRRDNFGSDMFSLKDRNDKPMVLGPSHEEMFIMVAAMGIKSYKDFPLNLFQMQTKFRDETRPRYGLVRLKEFIMKDAYSFDRDLDGLSVSYDNMYKAYTNIFNRIGLDFTVVKADTGVMGGFLSEEFHAVTDIGEDTLVICDDCHYSTNLDVAECACKLNLSTEIHKAKKLEFTPNSKTIEEVATFFNRKPENFVKTLIYKCDGNFYAFLVRGDKELNEIKVKHLLDVKICELASITDVEKITNASVGFAGPIGLKIPIIADLEIQNMANFIVGANKTDYHFVNVNLSDFKVQQFADIRTVVSTDVCPKCGYKFTFKKGIEVGNIFKYGSKYSDSMGLYFVDEDGKQKPFSMGAYGIGIERCIASFIEQHHDDKGIIWKRSLAPYEVCIVTANEANETQSTLGENLYNSLMSKGVDVLYDNRNERIGVKLNDMDLIGIPVRILVGKRAGENIVEVKYRKSPTVIEYNLNNGLEELIKIIFSSDVAML
ncbi:MAG: proline--tRNA ligase [Clostridia bacterium]